MFHQSQSFLQPQQKFCKRNRTKDFEDELNDLFNKKFQFLFESDWELPPRDLWFSTPPWKRKELDVLKSRLNFHKSQLNDFNIEEWSCHTRKRNPAGEVCWKVRCMVNPEFLTQAWTKFYECAVTYNIVPLEALARGEMVSLHLCEAPGAFITSLNHYLKTNHHNIKWKWLANTLNPYYEGNSSSSMISDDRFMFHTLDNWHFGVDNTGNLMDWDNSQAIINKAKSLGKVQLVTADGSIDCLQKPDAQEEVTSPLHYCEIVTALQTLTTGGTLIFKLFTIFEHSTVCLLYLINHLFNEVNIYKPVTSRQGNSEVYAVCLNYTGANLLEPYISVLKSAYGTELYGDKAMFPLAVIPVSFLKQIEDCAYYFSSIQCQVINNNLQSYFLKNITPYEDIKRMRGVVATEFIRHYELKPLQLEKEILKGVLHEESKVNMNPRYHRGSYTARQSYSKMSSKGKLDNLKAFLRADVLVSQSNFINDAVTWLSLYSDKDLKLMITYGRPLRKINSSKFVFVPIFKLYQQILAEEEFKEIITSRSSKGCINGLADVRGTKTLSLPEFDHKMDYNIHEKRCFKEILNVLCNMSVGETLLLQNFNILTQFGVSFLYLLSVKCFEMTGFTSTDGIILKKLVRKDALKDLYEVDAKCATANSEARDILNLLPVQVTNDGEFFSNVVLYNNTFYRNKCMEYLSTIEKSIEISVSS